MAGQRNRKLAWKTFLCVVGFELCMTLSFLVETGGVVMVKHVVKVPADYTGNLEEALLQMEWQIPEVLKVALSIPMLLRVIVVTALVVAFWTLLKTLFRSRSSQGWGWLAVGWLSAVMMVETAAAKLGRIAQAQAELEQAVAADAYQVSRTVTFYEDIKPLAFVVLGVIAVEALLVFCSVQFNLRLTPVLLPVCVLCFYGLLLQAASDGMAGVMDFVKYTVLGLVVCLFCWALGVMKLTRNGCYKLCYLLILLALVSCVLGNLNQINGSGAWIRILGVSVQTGELFKVFVVLYAAYAYPYLKTDQKLNSLFYIVCLVLCGVLLLENDSGNMFILAMLVVVVAFLDDYVVGAGLAIATVVGLPVLVKVAAAYSSFEQLPLANLFAHISSRFSGMCTVLENPEANSTFRATLLGILKGGFLGVGVDESRSSFFPTYAAYADYAFASIVAVWGLFAGLILLGCYIMILRNADTPFQYCRRSENYLAGKLATSVLALQMIFHVGAALNLFPFMGTNLPFVSRGGSSMVTSWMLIGIILSSQADDRRSHAIHAGFDKIFGRIDGQKVDAFLEHAFSLKEEQA